MTSTMSDIRSTTPVLVIGGGIAGLTTALVLAWQGVETTVLTTDESLIESGNTPLAQGGIVYTAPDDTPSLLERDIMTAGWRHNSVQAVRHLCRKGPEVLKDILLDRVAVPFDTRGDGLSLTREGGHSLARIVHCADYTGLAIMRGLVAAVEAHPNITVLPGRTAVDLLTSHHHSTRLQFKYQLTNQCLGAYVHNGATGQVETILADQTVLATGGIGQIYLHTTNSGSAIGSGLSMAHRAGAKILNAEFVQFHPTALCHRSQGRSRRSFLISEAVRGEGARLINSRGERFMTRYDSRADLAPRDIVARAIQEEMLRTGDDCVYLDAASHVPGDIAARFPTIYGRCLEIGVDITRQPIPVVPAAHYFCGGVLVDNRGRTTLERLYAAGESSCTGLHGANRLASTSLLEALVWGAGVGADIAKRGRRASAVSRNLADSIPDWVSPGAILNEDPALIAQDWATIRHTMWNYVGITRTGSRLRRAFEDLRDLNKRLHDFYKETPISRPIVDIFHGCQAAYIVTLAAMLNKKSIGCHYRIG
jgi:L-aspartate oxidase